MITNKLNIDPIFVKAVTPDNEHNIEENVYYVTELLNDPHYILLNRKYKNIDEDANDMLNRLFGTALHEYLEKFRPSNCINELSISFPIGKFTIKGRLDLWDIENSTIIDYKSTTVSQVMKADFEEHRDQALIYAYGILYKFGLKTKYIKIHEIMKDWSKMKFINSKDYPQSAIYTYIYQIKDSDYDYIYDYIKRKLNAVTEDAELYKDCELENKWFTGDKYAVYKKVGDKKAAAVLDSEQEAHDFITNKCGGSGEIQYRKGECLKCKYYCKFREVCKNANN